MGDLTCSEECALENMFGHCTWNLNMSKSVHVVTHLDQDSFCLQLQPFGY